LAEKQMEMEDSPGEVTAEMEEELLGMRIEAKTLRLELSRLTGEDLLSPQALSGHIYNSPTTMSVSSGLAGTGEEERAVQDSLQAKVDAYRTSKTPKGAVEVVPPDSSDPSASLWFFRKSSGSYNHTATAFAGHDPILAAVEDVQRRFSRPSISGLQAQNAAQAIIQAASGEKSPNSPVPVPETVPETRSVSGGLGQAEDEYEEDYEEEFEAESPVKGARPLTISVEHEEERARVEQEKERARVEAEAREKAHREQQEREEAARRAAEEEKRRVEEEKETKRRAEEARKKAEEEEEARRKAEMEAAAERNRAEEEERRAAQEEEDKRKAIVAAEPGEEYEDDYYVEFEAADEIENTKNSTQSFASMTPATPISAGGIKIAGVSLAYSIASEPIQLPVSATVSAPASATTSVPVSAPVSATAAVAPHASPKKGGGGDDDYKDEEFDEYELSFET